MLDEILAVILTAALITISIPVIMAIVVYTICFF